MAYPTETEGADVEILQKVAEETGYNFDDLWKIYGYESSHGKHPDMNEGIYQGPFQFDKRLADSLGIDRYDLYESATAFVKHLEPRKKSLRENIKNTSGDYSWIDSLRDNEPALLDYLLHQQGGKGLARMSLAYDDNYFYYMQREDPIHNVRYKLLENLKPSQQEHLIKKTRSPKEAIDYYIKVTKENLENQ